MKTFKIRAAIASVAIVATAGLALTACSTGTSSGSGSDKTGTYTAAEVAKASGSYAVKPLFAVPKDVKPIHLAFMNPALSFPFFATWNQGMKDAAKFYGVSLDVSDLNFKYENALSSYQQLAVKQPVVLGAGGGGINAPTVAAAKADGASVVTIDGAIAGAKTFGVSDEQVGQLAATTLEPAISKRIDSDWKGKKLIVAGISAANCAPCDARIRASFTSLEAKYNLSSSDTFSIEPAGADPTTGAQDVFSAFLTAHPDNVIAVVSYGDETVVGAVNAAKADGRTNDVLGVSSGGDAVARTALRDSSDAKMLVGAIDYQPYQEGWNWVEAAIATSLKKSFNTYSVTRVLTSTNVDQYYPNDKK